MAPLATEQVCSRRGKHSAALIRIHCVALLEERVRGFKCNIMYHSCSDSSESVESFPVREAREKKTIYRLIVLYCFYSNS